MVIAGWEGDGRITCFLRGYPDRTVAHPFSGENILGKSRKQGCRQRRLFEGESVKGPWNDDESAIRNLEAQGFMQCTWGKKIELTVQDHRRDADRRKLRRQRFELEKRLHQILQSIDVIGQPALPFDRFEVAELRSKPCVRQ